LTENRTEFVTLTFISLRFKASIATVPFAKTTEILLSLNLCLLLRCALLGIHSYSLACPAFWQYPSLPEPSQDDIQIWKSHDHPALEDDFAHRRRGCWRLTQLKRSRPNTFLNLSGKEGRNSDADLMNWSLCKFT